MPIDPASSDQNAKSTVFAVLPNQSLALDIVCQYILSDKWNGRRAFTSSVWPAGQCNGYAPAALSGGCGHLDDLSKAVQIWSETWEG
jgi:hypothetical protein